MPLESLNALLRCTSVSRSRTMPGYCFLHNTSCARAPTDHGIARRNRSLDKTINAVASKLSGNTVFRSFPAAADVFAPRLLAVFGEDRSRFRSAAEVQRYCGVAPVTERSGKQNWIHWRYRCSKFQRQTLVEWAGLTIRRSYWAEQFYKQHRARGAGHHAALRALAFKWVRILFRCWQTGESRGERGS
jgi:transposase